MPTVLPTPEPVPVETALRAGLPRVATSAVRPAYAPISRIMVSTRGNPKLLSFALEQARLRQAELLILFVRHLAVPTMGSTNVPDVNRDPEAQAMFRDAEQAAAQAGVPIRLLYAVSGDVADAILDLAVTHGVDCLILGATQRGAPWRTMKGDILQRVGQYLPERTSLLIHA